MALSPPCVGGWLFVLDAQQLDPHRVRQRFAPDDPIDGPPDNLIGPESGEDIDGPGNRPVPGDADGVQHPLVPVAQPHALAVPAVSVEVPGAELTPLGVEADPDVPGD